MGLSNILAIVLAGGKGERFFPLTAFRSKPSVPFGARYRIVDFVLSNMVNSRIYSIYLLVQYKSQSLIEHVRQNWMMSPAIKDHFVTVVPPQMRTGPEWFQGTAEAVFQNSPLIREYNPKLVAVFGADQVYRMDIRQMMDFHLKKDAFVTVAAGPVPIEQASSFGVIVSDNERRIVRFQEKPKNPTPLPGDPAKAHASMGNYIFNSDILLESLEKAQRKKQYDFGTHVIPSLIETGRVFAYDFETNTIPGTGTCEKAGYWRDLGTIAAFFETHMDMLREPPLFDITNKSWPIHAIGYEGPGTKIIRADISNSIIAEGAIINNARVHNSFIRSGVQIEDGVEIEDSIIFDHVVLKRGSKLRRVIVDKFNVIYEGEQIGFNHATDRFRCHIDQSGIRILPRGGRPLKEIEG